MLLGLHEQQTISGQVLLSSGKPAANAFLVRQSFGQGKQREWSHRVDCDTMGRFTFPADSPLANQVHAYSADLKESLLENIDTIPADHRLTFRLKPSCLLTLTFSVLGEPGRGKAMLSVLPTLNLPWLGMMDAKGQVKIWVPKGEYNINVTSDDCDFDQKTVTLKEGEQAIKIEGTPNPFRKLKGRPSPELEILDAIGFPKNGKLSDLRGKYVVLEFWGYWCKPCVESSIPEWIKFWKGRPNINDKLAILAIHENTGGGRTLDAIRSSLPTFERKFWGGKLPFPIILEKPGSLTTKFGIRAYPTAVLIDPQGKVIDRAEPNSVKEILGLSK